jgi:ABC-type nickel/cobalt efflux system permease component RcnA
MNWSRRLSLTVLLLLAAHLSAPVAFAHPLGNFTTNHFAELRVSADSLSVDYVLDLAEIPAFQALAALDANGNGQPDENEMAAYRAEQCAAIRAGLSVSANGATLALSFGASGLSFPPGMGGLPTLRLTCTFRAVLAPTADEASLQFAANVFPERLGWREIVVVAEEGLMVRGDVATESISRRLTAYPESMLTSSLDERQVTFVVMRGAGESASIAPANAPATADQTARGDAFTELIALPELTLPVMLLGLVIAFVWGAGHALTPGHGKTIVAAYLVGSRGTARHALYLGLTTTITHTAGVFALGLVTLLASEHLLPETLFPWLSLISGLIVVWLGASLFLSRWRGLRLTAAHAHHHDHHHHDHDHAHGHDHSHEHHHPQHHEHGHSHAHPHDQDHAHGHSHAHLHEHDHEHGPHTHTHLPPGADGSPVTWRSLLALGISGGLLPCPSALVVLLGAIAFNRVEFGLLLVLVFSLGLAGTLTAIGLAMVYARRFFERVPTATRWMRLASAGSALFILVAGLGLTFQALSQIGIL